MLKILETTGCKILTEFFRNLFEFFIVLWRVPKESMK